MSVRAHRSSVLTSLVQLLGQAVGKGWVAVDLVTATRTHGDKEAAEVPRGVPPEVVLQLLAVLVVVGILDGPGDT